MNHNQRQTKLLNHFARYFKVWMPVC